MSDEKKDPAVRAAAPKQRTRVSLSRQLGEQLDGMLSSMLDEPVWQRSVLRAMFVEQPIRVRLNRAAMRMILGPSYDIPS